MGGTRVEMGGAAGAGILSEGELGFAVGWASEYHVIWRCLSVVCLVVNLGMLDIRTEMDTNTTKYENRM